MDDSGTPLALTNAIVDYRGDFSASSIVNRGNLVSTDDMTAGQQAVAINKDLLKSLPRW